MIVSLSSRINSIYKAPRQITVTKHMLMFQKETHNHKNEQEMQGNKVPMKTEGDLTLQQVKQAEIRITLATSIIW
jgi:hypothetical protein